jgi:hypothetical protein
MVKYKQVFENMLKQNRALFEEFKIIHDQFALQPNKWRAEFNEKGEEVQTIIRRFENQLCKHTESGGFGKFSGGLSEKFWEEIRKMFSKIDEIGIEK